MHEVLQINVPTENNSGKSAVLFSEKTDDPKIILYTSFFLYSFVFYFLTLSDIATTICPSFAVISHQQSSHLSLFCSDIAPLHHQSEHRSWSRDQHRDQSKHRGWPRDSVRAPRRAEARRPLHVQPSPAWGKDDGRKGQILGIFDAFLCDIFIELFKRIPWVLVLLGKKIPWVLVLLGKKIRHAWKDLNTSLLKRFK